MINNRETEQELNDYSSELVEESEGSECDGVICEDEKGKEDLSVFEEMFSIMIIQNIGYAS